MKKFKYFILFSTIANLIFLVGVFSLANFKNWDLTETVFLLLGLQFFSALTFVTVRGSFESRMQNRLTLFKGVVYLGNSLGICLVFFLFGSGFLLDQNIFKAASIFLASSLFIMIGAIGLPFASEINVKPKFLILIIIAQMIINLGLTTLSCFWLTSWFD